MVDRFVFEPHRTQGRRQCVSRRLKLGVLVARKYYLHYRTVMRPQHHTVKEPANRIFDGATAYRKYHRFADGYVVRFINHRHVYTAVGGARFHYFRSAYATRQRLGFIGEHKLSGSYSAVIRERSQCVQGFRQTVLRDAIVAVE